MGFGAGVFRGLRGLEELWGLGHSGESVAVRGFGVGGLRGLRRGARGTTNLIFHFTSTNPPKTPGGSTVRDFYVEFDFLGLGCDHAVLEQLEAKNLSKRATCLQKQPIFGGFWLLATLEQHGRTPHLKNRILHENPERLPLMESLGE